MTKKDGKINKIAKYMRNKIYIILIFQLVSSCEIKSGQRSVALSIKESKKRGVFIREYTVNPNPYLVNDSIKLTVKEAWLEHKWYYTSIYGKIKKYENGFQIKVRMNEGDCLGNSYTYSIGKDDSFCLDNSYGHSLVGLMDEMPPDTIIYKIYSGVNTINIDRPVIGRLILTRK